MVHQWDMDIYIYIYISLKKQNRSCMVAHPWNLKWVTTSYNPSEFSRPSRGAMSSYDQGPGLHMYKPLTIPGMSHNIYILASLDI